MGISEIIRRLAERGCPCQPGFMSRPHVVYLLTHDTDPENIPGTALPMREIDAALKDNLSAEKVVIIADSCHSAAVGGKVGRRGIADSAVINTYLEGISKSNAGLALLTSAQASETSLESDQWGGGHGVFTHFLLEGMRGKADRSPKNGTVTVGELFEYVRAEVKRETNDAQHPVIGTNSFDPNLPLAITGGIDAKENLQLGCCMNQLGWLLNEPPRFAFARTRLQEALDFAKRCKEKLPEAQLQKGLAEMALGDHEAAIVTLRQAIKDDKERRFPEAHLHLGVALARTGNTKQADTAMRKFRKLRPDDARLKFVDGFLSRPVARVLLIGIGDYQTQNLSVPGPVNDIRMMKQLLVGHYEIAESNISTLINAEATQHAILAELVRLRKKARPKDQVLVYFSGHAHEGSETEHYLIPYDYDPDKPRSVTAQQLHDLLNGIPSRQKMIIIDSTTTTKFVELARKKARYRLLLATSPDLQVYEGTSDEGLPVGRFTNALVKQLAQNPTAAPLEGTLEVVANSLARGSQPQKPVLVGNMRAGLLTVSAALKDILEGYDFSLRCNYDALSLDEIHRGYARADENSFLQLHLSYGRAFLEKRQFSDALEALKLAAREHSDQVPEVLLSLGMAHLHNQDYERALTSLRDYASHDVEAQAPLQTMNKLKDQRKHAVLVGIDQYRAGEIAPLRGAVNDIHLVAETLIERCNFAKEDIQLLTNEQATRGAIDAAFDALVHKAHNDPALFYFAGYGSLSESGEPTIVPVDRGVVSYPNDIAVRDLAAKTAAAVTNLVTIIDAGWQESVSLPYGDAWGGRFVPPQPGERPLTRVLFFDGKIETPRRPSPEWHPDSAWKSERERVQQLIGGLRIGRLSIYHVSIQSALCQQKGQGGEPVAEAEFPAPGSNTKIHGVLTHALMEVLRQKDSSSLTYHELAEAAAKRLKWVQPFLIGENPAEALFSSPVQEQEIHERVFTRIRQRPIRQAIPLLNRLIEQAGGKHAEANLNLAVAHAALGEFKESRIALVKAIEERGKSPIPEAHYYLGRVLYQMGEELDLAISELRKALEEDPQNVSAHYFFAHAVRQRTEQKTLVEAEQAFKVYLENGAPLGNREEVEEVLNRWRDQGSGSGTGTGFGWHRRAGIGAGSEVEL